MLQILTKETGENARHYITRVLMNNIVNLTLLPGEQLQETEICAQLHVSRTPVREAILELSQIKLIDIYPQRGTYVSLIDGAMVEDVRYLRCVLESDLAALACDCADQEDFDYLYENIQLQKLYNQRNSDKLMRLDNEFHCYIYRLCGKEFLYDMVKKLMAHFDRVRKLRCLADLPMMIIDDHEKLVKAIKQKDKEAAREISNRHMQRSIEDEPLLRKKFPEYYAN